MGLFNILIISDVLSFSLYSYYFAKEGRQKLSQRGFQQGVTVQPKCKWIMWSKYKEEEIIIILGLDIICKLG